MKYNKILKSILVISILACNQIAIASISTDAQIQYNRGIDYYRAGQIAESITCFRHAIDLDPNYIDAYYNLGSIMEYINNDKEALSAFKQIILRKPDDFESAFKAAEISNRLGETDKAKMYLSLIPESSSAYYKAKELSDSIISAELLAQKALEEAGANVQNKVEEVQNAVEEIQQTVENARAEAANAADTAVENVKAIVNESVQQAVEKVSEKVEAIEQQVNEIKELPTLPDIEPLKDEEVNNIPVQKITTNGEYKDISSPTGIASDSDGNIYIADFADNLVYKIGEDEKKIVYIKNQKIDGPIGLAVDKFNNIYIANYNKDNVLKVNSNGLVEVFIDKISKPYCMYINGDLLFVSSQGGNSVIRRKLAD